MNAVKRGQAIFQTMATTGLCIKGKRVLDVGCGSCGIYIAFAQCDAEVVGIDVFKKNLELGKARILEENLAGNLILADAQDLPLKDYSFDIVICNDVIEHVENPLNCEERLFCLKDRWHPIYYCTKHFISGQFFKRPPL